MLKFLTNHSKSKTVENHSVLQTTDNEWIDDYDFQKEETTEEDLNSYKEHTLSPVTLN